MYQVMLNFLFAVHLTKIVCETTAKMKFRDHIFMNCYLNLETNSAKGRCSNDEQLRISNLMDISSEKVNIFFNCIY